MIRGILGLLILGVIAAGVQGWTGHANFGPQSAFAAEKSVAPVPAPRVKSEGGASRAPSTTAQAPIIPEPATAMMMAVAGVMAFSRRRRPATAR